RRADRRSIRELLPPWWLPYVRGLETTLTTVRAVTRPESTISAGRRSAVPDTPRTSEDRPWWSAHPWLTTVLVLAFMSVVAARSVLAGGPLHGGALPPAPDSAG